MPRQSLEFRIVVASPSDVFETRKFVFDAIHEVDRVFEQQSIAIRGVGWEEYASPGIGSEAQDVINQQILKEYDILIAIFGAKLGSATKTERSGTVAEIEHAIGKQNDQMGLHRIQVYFCDKIESLSTISIDELKRLEDYRKSLSDRGVLYRMFSTGEQLQRDIRTNIQRAITWHLQQSGHPLSTTKTISAPALPTANEDQPSEQPAINDLGFLDHQEKAELAAIACGKSIETMTALIAEINAETNRNVEALETVSGPSVPIF